jgi:hypothetical protein
MRNVREPVTIRIGPRDEPLPDPDDPPSHDASGTRGLDLDVLHEPLRVIHLAVRVEEHKDLSSACFDPPVPGEGRSSILGVVHDPDVRVLLEHAQSAVRRGVVYNYDLEVRIRLPSQSVKASTDVSFSVEARNYD